VTCARGCCASPAEHYRSIRIAAAATPTRRASTVAQEATERQMVTDTAAYKRMRAEGLRPAVTKGAALLEAKATNRFEIESGRIYPPAPDKDQQIADGLGVSSDIGLITPANP
jgi:hypothetical protein